MSSMQTIPRLISKEIDDDDDDDDMNKRTRNRSREILLEYVEEVCKNDNIFIKMIARIMKMIEKTR